MAILAIAGVGALVGAGVATAVGVSVSVGVSIGWAVGSYIGQKMFAPSQDFEGPRLSDLQVQASTDGAPLPIIYGTARIRGNIIWTTGIKETRHDEDVGGKGSLFGGGGTSTTYTYAVNMALTLCKGTITGVRRIWLDGKLVWSIADGASPSTFAANTARGTIRLYVGDATQTADSLIAADVGAANCPGYRGTAYLVFEEWQLADFANHIPMVEAEVVVDNSGTYPYLRQVISGFTPWDMALDYRRNRGVYTEKQPDSTSKLYTWDFTSATPVEFATVGDLFDSLTNPGDAVIVVDAVLDEYHLIRGSQSGGSTITWQTFDGSSGASKGQRSINTADFSPFADGIGGTDGALINPTGWNWYPEDGGWLIGTASGFSSSKIYIIRFRPATGALIGEVLGTNTVFERQGSVTDLIDSDGGVWVVAVDHFQRLIPTPLSVASSASMSPTRSFIWKARQEIWAHNSSGSDWSVLDIANKSSSLGSTLYASSTSYNTGVENSLGQVWFLKDSATTQYLDGVLLNSDLSVEMTKTAFVQATDFIQDAYLSLPGVIIGNEQGTSVQAFYEHSLAQAGQALDVVQADILSQVGITAYDVTALTSDTVLGFIIARPMTARQASEPLQMAYGYDGVETDEVIRFVKRGGASIVTIPQEDMGVRAGGPETEATADFTVTRALETELPATLYVMYINQTTDYNIAAEYSRRLITSAENIFETQLPLVMTSTTANRLAENLQHQFWLERDRYTFVLGPKYSYLDPTDVVTLYDGTRVRITKMSQDQDGVVAVEGVGDDDASLTSYATASTAEWTGDIDVLSNGVSVAAIIDSVLLRDNDDDIGWYGGICGETSSYPGGVLYQSKDNGLTWVGQAASTTSAKIGTVVSGVLNYIPPEFCNLWDNSSVITVKLAQSDLTLSSAASIDSFYAGSNAFLISLDGNNWELAQCYTVTDNGDGTYTLMDFLRGRRGSEANAGPFTEGATIVFVDSTRMQRIAASLNDIDATSLWKAVTSGGNIVDEVTRTRTFEAVSAKPLAPVQIGGGKISGTGNINIFWVRRARHDMDWHSSGINATLDETNEEYELEIWDEGFGSLKRTVTGLSSPSYTYTAAMQTTDFGGSTNVIGVKVYQISDRVGRGFPGEALQIGTVQAPLVFDPSFVTTGFTLSQDGRKITRSGSSGAKASPTRGFTTGKLYWEMNVVGTVSADILFGIGNVTSGTSYWRYRGNSTVLTSGATDFGGTNYTIPSAKAGIYRFAVDFTLGYGWMGFESRWLGSQTPDTGLAPHFTFTPASTWAPYIWSDTSGASYTVEASFQFGNTYPPPDGFRLIR